MGKGDNQKERNVESTKETGSAKRRRGEKVEKEFSSSLEYKLTSYLSIFSRCTSTLKSEMKMQEELSSVCLGKLFPKLLTTLSCWPQER